MKGMQMTNELRKLVKTKLGELVTEHGIANIAYQLAPDTPLYPHIVFTFDRISAQPDDLCRYDYRLIIDVWDRSDSMTKVLDISDAVIKKLSAKNIPQTSILPTFFYESSNNVIDEDKKIRHIQVTFQVQNYEV